MTVKNRGVEYDMITSVDITPKKVLSQLLNSDGRTLSIVSATKKYVV